MRKVRKANRTPIATRINRQRNVYRNFHPRSIKLNRVYPDMEFPEMTLSHFYFLVQRGPVNESDH